MSRIYLKCLILSWYYKPSFNGKMTITDYCGVVNQQEIQILIKSMEQTSVMPQFCYELYEKICKR